MELTAAIEGLRAAPDGAEVELVTDSAYLAHAIEKGWLRSWQRNGWMTSARKPVANRDLWEQLIGELARMRAVRPVLVRGHAGHAANERADRLAQSAAMRAGLD
jgi:ribonuclease HI